MKYQTDFGNALDIEKSGCYVCAITSEIEKAIGFEIPDYTFEQIIEDANAKKYLSHDFNDWSRPGCFIMNDEGFGNLILQYLGVELKFVSVGRIYTAEGLRYYAERNISVSDTAKHSDIANPNVMPVLNIQTVNGGHFRNIWHDPFRPGTGMLYIKSFRYFRLDK